jgi:hypothetical protein
MLPGPRVTLVGQVALDFLTQECNVWVVELKMCPGFWLKAWLAGLASVLPSLLRPDAPPDMLVVGSARP